MFWRKLALAALTAMLATLAAAGVAGASYGMRAAKDSSSPDPAVREALDAFWRAAEKLYEAAVRGDAEHIQLLVRETDERLRALPMRQIASAEGVEALARSVARMKRAAASIQGPARDWQTPAAEIRLAADALAHPDKPMWHMYRDIVMEDIGRIAQALESGRQDPARAGLKSLEEHYGLIRTAILLHADPFVIERTDSVLRYAQRVLSADRPKPELLEGIVPSLRDAFGALFPSPSAGTMAYVPAAGPGGWAWPALFASVIVAVLTWAGWLRYRQIEPVIPRGNLPPARHEHRRSQ